MKPAFLAPRGALENKPGHGKPCNSCGMCCMGTICPLGQTIFKRQLGPCPALVRNDDRTFGCGLVVDPMRWSMKRTLENGVQRMRDAALHLIGAGQGCDARFNGEPPDPAFYEKLAEHDRKTVKQTREAKRLWGVGR